MLLAVDSGNTNIVFGLYDNAQNLGRWRLKNDPHRPTDEYVVFLNQWLSMIGYGFKEIDDVIISSVVPETLFHLKNMTDRYFKNKPLVIGEPSVNLDLKIKIEKPYSIGADCLVNAYGGYRQYGGPLLVMDFGTATTFDLIDEEGGYLGGVIAPGVNLSLKALYEAGAKLPPTTFARTEKVLATRTPIAMQSGCYWGYVGMVEGISSRICKEYEEAHGPSKITLVATGGLSSFFSKDLPRIHHFNETLTLDSLALIYRDQHPR